MKKSLTWLAGASMLVLGVPTISMAQTAAASGPFADVPADHWAYQSVENLQNAGIVIGYPDGTYGGKRAMTRYEFAVAIARLLPLLSPKNDYATNADLAALRAEVENKLQTNAAALEDLKKLVNEFQGELQALGQDVTAIKARLSSLEDRVAAVEEEQRRIKFNGALNFIVEGDNQGKHNAFGFHDKNGTLVANGGNEPKVTENIDVYHDFVLAIKGKLSDTATANVKLDFGNYLSAIGNVAAPGYPTSHAFNNNSAFANSLESGHQAPGTATTDNQYANVWEAYLSSPVDLGPLGGADIKIGRFGQQYTKYTLKQVDSDVYTSLYQTDSGNIIGDGGAIDLKAGPFKINGFATKYSTIQFSQPYGGSVVSSHNSQVGARPIGLLGENNQLGSALDQGAGVRATIGAPEGGVLGITVEQFGTTGFQQSNERTGAAGAYDRLSVYGADYNGAVPFFGGSGLLLDANYTVSAEGRGGKFNNVNKGWRNTSLDTQLGATFGAFTVKGGYQFIGPDFTAPGYWGKLGNWTNPTNVEGGVASLKYAFSPALTLNADYEGYKAAYGATKDGQYLNSPLQSGDKATRYQVGLGYGLTSDYNVDFGYERVEYDLKNNIGPDGLRPLANAGKPTESYYTIGLGHSFNPNASLKLVYQVVAFRDKNTGFGASSSNLNGGNEDGGVTAAQFQLKF